MTSLLRVAAVGSGLVTGSAKVKGNRRRVRAEGMRFFIAPEVAPAKSQSKGKNVGGGRNPVTLR